METVSRAISAAAVMKISPAPFRGLLFSPAEQPTPGGNSDLKRELSHELLEFSHPLSMTIDSLVEITFTDVERRGGPLGVFNAIITVETYNIDAAIQVTGS